MSSARSIHTRDDLRHHVLEAFGVGQRLELDDAVYGPATDGSGYNGDTMSYYPLLAGHVALTGTATVVEIGTHYGGSTLALLAGLRAGAAQDPLLVTMDVTELNVERLAREPEITRLTGDSTEPGFVLALASLLPTPTPDLLYVDALKDAGYVLRTLHNVHRAGLAPTWLILDDIQATDSMRDLWAVLDDVEPDQTFLLSRDFPHIRNPRYGYAIIHVAGTAGLLSRCVELAERLGLDTTGMTDVDDRFDQVRDVEPVADLAADAPTLGTVRTERLLLASLAQTYVTGDGEVVDFGCTVGTTTRVLADALEANPTTDATRRVHAFDSFVHDHASLRTLLADRVAPGASLRPLFDESIGGHAVNVYPVQPHVGRWYGAPIELLLAGAVRSPRVGAHLIAEFSPHFLAGKTVLVYRDGLSTHRPWIALAIAYLSDHFELLRVNHALTVHGFTSPVPRDKITRLVEDRFTATERVDLICSYAALLRDAEHRWSFLAHAGAIAVRLHLLTRAVEIESELSTIGTGGDDRRVRRLTTLRERIDAARADTTKEAR